MDPKIVGALGLLCLCSISSSIAASMGGSEETPPAGAGAGADPVTGADAGADAGAGADPVTGADAGDTEEDTGPTMLKCINTQKRGDMGWVFKGRVKTEAEARALCPDSEYMSLECPMTNGFEVWCVDNISQADVLLDKECKGDVAGTPLHGGKNLHCVGPYTWGDVNGGGANRGSLYKI
mgnify:CR=1 FL=1